MAGLIVTVVTTSPLTVLADGETVPRNATLANTGEHPFVPTEGARALADYYGGKPLLYVIGGA